MDAGTAVRTTRMHRARRHVVVLVAVAALACAALPGTATAAGPPRLSAGSVPAHAGLHHRVASPSLLALARRIAAVRTSGSAHVRALPAGGASLCVGTGAGCLRTIPAALDAAHEGDTIHVGVDPSKHDFTFEKGKADADAELAGASH